MKLHKEGNDVECPDTFGGTSPGAVRVPGIGNDDGSEGQAATVASREESTIEIIARVVDTEEENRTLHAQERLLLERDQLLRERDQLRQIAGNAVIVHAAVAPKRDVEKRSKEVARGVINDRDLPENNKCKCGTRGRRCLAIGAILLTVIAIVIPSVIVLQPDPPVPNELECTQMADATCRMEGYPRMDFHVDFSCPASASNVLDCSTCTFVSDDTGSQCNSCTICTDTVAYDCSNIDEGDCVSKDCSGNCENPTPAPSTQAPTVPSKTDIPCSQMADGSLSCRVDDYPGEDFHVDFSCPASASTISECSSCAIIRDDSVDQCNSCSICADTVAYDCSNIAEGDCVIKDCSGNCENPTPAPTTPMPTGPSDCGGICIPENESCDITPWCCCDQMECRYTADPYTGQSWGLCEK